MLTISAKKFLTLLLSTLEINWRHIWIEFVQIFHGFRGKYIFMYFNERESRDWRVGIVRDTKCKK
jgi:hypothetical protein